MGDAAQSESGDGAGRRLIVRRREFTAALLASPLLALAEPVFAVDVPAPTKDKPQSKLWFAHGSWWAWLPVSGGSSIWRRTSAGWRRQHDLDAPLRGLPGQADVWADRDYVRAVLVEPRRLAVAGLRWDARIHRYRWSADAVEFGDATGAIETATIARDATGRWCVAYNSDRRMWIRMSLSPDSRTWSDAVEVSGRMASVDDICAVVALPGEVAVMWSDQVQDAVYFRRHSDGAPPERWGEMEIVEQGGKTADDHINIAAAGDGRLFVATKNSVDREGAPQQVLRVRDRRGAWSNHPYAPLTPEHAPTRPVAQLDPGASRLFLIHTAGLVGRRPAASVIVCQDTDPTRLSLGGPPRTLIQAGTAVNNVTGSKARLPKGAAWVVLASDSQGGVYEGRLDIN